MPELQPVTVGGNKIIKITVDCQNNIHTDGDSCLENDSRILSLQSASNAVSTKTAKCALCPVLISMTSRHNKIVGICEDEIQCEALEDRNASGYKE